MNSPRHHAAHPPLARSGLTLLEVLISIGILAVGLSSVLALVPAARSQASRAVVLDRATVLAANTLADAATFGLLRESFIGTSTTPRIVDPAATSAYLPGTVLFWTPARGVFSNTTGASVANPALGLLFSQGRDDTLVQPSTAPDLPPSPMFDVLGGQPQVRAFEGRFSSLLSIQSDTFPINASSLGTSHRVSVVVFHSRDPGLTAVSATMSNFQIPLSTLGSLNGRRPAEIIRPGVVLFANGRFHQAVAASLAPSVVAGQEAAYLTLSTGTALLGPNVAVHFLPDSVALAERVFRPETPGPFSQ